MASAVAGIRMDAPLLTDATMDGVRDYDIDADGVLDIDNLAAGHNPYLPGEPELCAGGPIYGCAHIAPRPDFSLTALCASLLGLAGLVWRRRGATRRN
jgi:hypothetical protein